MCTPVSNEATIFTPERKEEDETHPDDPLPSLDCDRMNLIQKLTLWRKIRKIKSYIRKLEKQRAEFFKTLEMFRNELIS